MTIKTHMKARARRVAAAVLAVGVLAGAAVAPAWASNNNLQGQNDTPGAQVGGQGQNN
jgi:hypothetical protein